MKLLEGKVAVITGSGRGIGRKTALMFAEQGASVVIHDIDRDAAEDSTAAVQGVGGRAVCCVGDVTERDMPEEIVQRTVAEFGKLDILVNNAGYTWDAMVEKMTDEQWYAMMDVHVTAPFRMIRAASPYMKGAAKRELDSGGIAYHRKIVNVTSMAGVTGNIGQTNYASAKAGVIGLTKAMAREWARYRINVNAVAFGFMDTRLTGEKEAGVSFERYGKKVEAGIPRKIREAFLSQCPFERPGTLEEAAAPILFLASPWADYISGHVLLVNGGTFM
jgi:3-oxoacyl-[acyl-carrier protein] reductase